jgi:hypothetical protein
MAHALLSVSWSASWVVTAGKRMGPRPNRRVVFVSTRTPHVPGTRKSCSTVIFVAAVGGVISSLCTPSG